MFSTVNDDDRVVCASCIGEHFLKQHVQHHGGDSVCSYCDSDARCIRLAELADFVERAFQDHYDRTSNEPEGLEWILIKESNYEWERHGEQAQWAIAEAADLDEELAEDVRKILEDRHADRYAAEVGEECPFEEQTHYIRKEPDDGEFPYLWDQFERDLKTKARFFSKPAHAILDRIFGELQYITTTDGRSAVVGAGPGTELDHLFRARVFRNEEEKLKEALGRPWTHLGTPPAKFASAGRMNARGIAVFYGARDAKTALAEARPPVGSDVAVARFNLIAPLKLLDLTALASVAVNGSIFDPSTFVALQQACFLGTLSRRLSRAIMPHEEESEYLPTQVVAEYLANEAKLDGIIFPSVQAGGPGTNIVLFHHAARVEEVSVPAGTFISVDFSIGDPDDPWPEYIVWEEVLQESEGAAEEAHKGLPLDLDVHDRGETEDDRHDTLSVQLDTIEIVRITAVSFASHSISVSRHRPPSILSRLKKSKVRTPDPNGT